MTLATDAPQWLAWLLAITLLIAAAEDAVRLRISNYTVIAVLALAIVAIVLAGFSTSLWENAVVFAAVLAVGTFLFAREILGGGDVKLLAAVCLWFNLSGSLALLTSVAIAGGVLAVLILSARMFVGNTASNRIAILNKNSGIPYGIAIAAGALVTMALARS
ncbi:MAG: prepilin peptidase [Sphingomicrobium sp.]